MLAVGGDFEVGLGVDSSLEADDEVVDVVLEVERVFPRGLLTATPARILERWWKDPGLAGDTTRIDT